MGIITIITVHIKDFLVMRYAATTCVFFGCYRNKKTGAISKIGIKPLFNDVLKVQLAQEIHQSGIFLLLLKNFSKIDFESQKVFRQIFLFFLHRKGTQVIIRVQKKEPR